MFVVCSALDAASASALLRTHLRPYRLGSFQPGGFLNPTESYWWWSCCLSTPAAVGRAAVVGLLRLWLKNSLVRRTNCGLLVLPLLEWWWPTVCDSNSSFPTPSGRVPERLCMSSRSTPTAKTCGDERLALGRQLSGDVKRIRDRRAGEGATLT